MKFLAYGLTAVLAWSSYTAFSAPLESLAQSNNDFGMRLFQQATKADAGKNVFISPISAQMALAMVASGADGQTLQEMQATLALSGHSIAEVNAAVKQYLATMDELNSDFTISIANSIWVNDTFKIYDTYRDNLVENFRAEAKNLDFTAPTASQEINGWVAKKTNDKITSVVPSQLNPETMMYLINATYFKADWTRPFQSDKHSKKFQAPFTLLDGSVQQLPTMLSTSSFKYVKADGYEAIELPYGQERSASMFIVMPSETKGFQGFVESMDLSDVEQVIGSLDEAGYDYIALQMPKFKFDYKIDLVKILADMGMPTAFTNSAEFPLMAPEALKIDQAFQKTFVAVDEKGTEAAAVTVIGMVRTTSVGRTPKIVKINRPFVFGIKENKTGSILFLGSIVKPEIK